MLNNEFKMSICLSGNYWFSLTIDSERFYKGSVTVHDNTMGKNVLSTSCGVEDVLKIYYWLNQNKYNSFNAYGGSEIAIVSFGEFVDNNCTSFKVLDVIIEYLDNTIYGGFDYSNYSESVALEEFERGVYECEMWRERDL